MLLRIHLTLCIVSVNWYWKCSVHHCRMLYDSRWWFKKSYSDNPVFPVHLMFTMKFIMSLIYWSQWDGPENWAFSPRYTPPSIPGTLEWRNCCGVLSTKDRLNNVCIYCLVVLCINIFIVGQSVYHLQLDWSMFCLIRLSNGHRRCNWGYQNILSDDPCEWCVFLANDLGCMWFICIKPIHYY